MRSTRRASVLHAAASAAAFLLALPRPADAQAWVPPKGEGNISITYQDLLARGHLLPNGKRASDACAICYRGSGHDPVRAHRVNLDVEYGLTDRLALSLQVPYITARYGGPSPHRLTRYGQPGNKQDNGSFRGTVQDIRLGARWNVVRSPLAITPYAEAVVPSHRYETNGHAAIGTDKRALVLGASLGRFLDPVLPRAFFQAQVSHTLVQKVMGFRANRTSVAGELGYFVTPRMAIRLVESFQRTHDGLDWPPVGLPRELSIQHDRIMRTNFLNVGMALSVAIGDSWDVSGTYGWVAWGQNGTPERRIAFNVNWHFRTGRAASEPSPGHDPGSLPPAF